MVRRITLPDPSRRPYAPDVPRILSGSVVSHQPGTNVIDVRVERAANRVIRNVKIPHDIFLQAGDEVLICKTSTETGWVCLVRLQERDSFGLDAADAMRENTPSPPTDFEVIVMGSLLVCQWTVPTFGNFSFEIQHNTTDSETNATSWYTKGSYFFYETESVTTRYFRGRTLHYDMVWNESVYSAWTDWESATSEPYATKTELDRLQALVYKFMQQWDETMTDFFMGNLGG